MSPSDDLLIRHVKHSGISCLDKELQKIGPALYIIYIYRGHIYRGILYIYKYIRDTHTKSNIVVQFVHYISEYVSGGFFACYNSIRTDSGELGRVADKTTVLERVHPL